jgi:alpha-ketoglutarate-dependent taurine dioxygenase
MALTFRKLHPCFAAEVGPIELRRAHDVDTLAGDLVIWDNRATMHRATPFDDAKYRRELRRVTTLDQ